MRILNKTGMKFHHPEILDILADNGVKISGNTAFFTETQIMDRVKKAPGRFTLYARNPKFDLHIGGDKVAYAPGYGAPNIIEADGSERSACYNDYIQFLKLYQQSDYFNINGGIIVQPHDLDAVNSFPVMLLTTLLYSDKCLLGGGGGKRETDTVMNLLSIVFGGRQGLLEKPRITTIINTLSPLQMDRDSLDTLLIYARHNQPVMVTPAAMAGTTGPVTLAGTIAMSNAEALAGIALTQMINKGVPVIYGFQATTSDMRTAGWTVGSPEHALAVSHGAKLAKFYGLPCRGGGAANDAKCVCVQSGYESMMVMMASRMAKMNLILMSAGTLDGHMAMSMEQFVVDMEILGMVERFTSGVRVEEDTLALDVIHAVGPGGEFLTQGHTLAHCRKESWLPEISIRGVLSGKNSYARLNENIENKMEKMLSAYQKPNLPIDIKENLMSYLGEKGFDLSMVVKD